MGWVFKQVLCPLYEKYNYTYSFGVTFLQLVTVWMINILIWHLDPFFYFVMVCLSQNYKYSLYFDPVHADAFLFENTYFSMCFGLLSTLKCSKPDGFQMKMHQFQNSSKRSQLKMQTHPLRMDSQKQSLLKTILLDDINSIVWPLLPGLLS